MKNITKLLALTASIVMLSSVIAMGSVTTAEARHGTLLTFDSGSVQYKCDSSLTSLNTAKYSSVCNEFGKAAKLWSDKVSNLDITKSSRNIEIYVIASSQLIDDRVAQMTPYQTSTKLSTAIITFSSDQKWGPSWGWSSGLSDRLDLQVASLHEIGHALSLDHDSGSPLMKDSMGPTDNLRSIPAHDLSTVQGKFR